MLIMGKEPLSTVNGPGNRAVIWFQGCTLSCAGCWSPHSHLFDGRKEVQREEIQQWILDRKDIEGVTFSGGEPMQQAPDLYLLLHFIRTQRPELSIGMFSGYTLQELEAGKWRWHSNYDAEMKPGSQQLWQQIRERLDFAVLGRYNQLVQTNELPLRGSRNQVVEFFTSRYTDADLRPQEIEFNIQEDGGLVTITGFPVGVNL